MNNKDKTINIEGLNKSMDDFLSGFQAGEIMEKSPSQVLNIGTDNKLFMVGFNLLLKDISSINYDTKDVSLNSFIMIDSRHALECLIILNGAFYGLEYILTNGNPPVFISTTDLLKVRDLVCKGIVTYRELVILANDIAKKYSDCAPSNIKDSLNSMIRNIWFLPYSEIDKCKDEIEKELGGKNE